MAFVFCAKEASLPIKSYSPELMVIPFYSHEEIFDQEDKIEEKVVLNEEDEEEQDVLITRMVSSVSKVIDRLHVVVIGPGLGRSNLVRRAVTEIITLLKEKDIP